MVTPNVTLRPAILADLDAFEQRFDSAADTGPYQWFGHTSMQQLRDVWEQRRLLRGDHNLLAVEADGELAARVDYFEKTWRIRRAQWRRTLARSGAAVGAAR